MIYEIYILFKNRCATYCRSMKANPKASRSGLVTASPSEFLVHQRFGRTRFLGRGGAAWVLPWIDRFALIPSGACSVSFCADQITAENQGVEVSGFAIWNIVDPKRVVEAVDFTEATPAVERIGAHLREVVESAIRHQVANLTLEETIRKRGSIIARLKQELAGVAEHWGLEITTVEIKTVRIMSDELFANMQARYRDKIRLESERSALQTDELIQRERAAAREEGARHEMAFREAEALRNETLARAQIERESDLERLQATKKLDLSVASLNDELQLIREKEVKRRAAVEAEAALIELDAELERHRFALEKSRTENRATRAKIEGEIERRRIAVANTADRGRLFLENLPSVLAGTRFETVNLGDPVLLNAIRQLGTLLTGSSRRAPNTRKMMKE